MTTGLQPNILRKNLVAPARGFTARNELLS